MKKIALVAFQGELMCFAHVLLYALDYREKGFEVAVIIEGAATRLIVDLAQPGSPFAGQYEQVRKAGLIDCVCKACAAKMGALEAAIAQGLPICSEMQGHPSLERYTGMGYEVLTF